MITQAFDDSVTVLMRFKLIDSFEGLLEREVLNPTSRPYTPYQLLNH